MSTPKPYIFISHSRQDREFTEFLAARLREAGFNIWVDMDSIPEGSTWPREIQKGVEECGAMVVVMSAEGRESEWVERETLLAMKLRKPVFVALIDDTPLPIHLINRQHTDFRKHPEQAAKRLIKALQATSLTEPLPPPKPREEARLALTPNEHNFFKYVEQLPNGKQNAEVARDLHRWAKAQVDEITFRGRVTPNFRAQVMVEGNLVTVFAVWAYSRQPAAEVPFFYLRRVPPYDERQLRLSTLDALNRLLPPGELFADEKADLRPSLSLVPILSTPQAREQFKAIISEIVENLRS
jgi:hypothetical protein